MNTENKFRTKKLHITVSADMFEKLQELKVMNNIDVVISDLLIEKYNLNEE